MSITAYIHSYLAFDYHTETAATAITEDVPGQNGKRLALVGFDYLNAATAHSLNIMHCGSLAGSRTTASALAVSGQKVVNATDAPTDPAGNATASGDFIAFQLTNGSWEFDTVASLSTLAITITNNLQGVDAGAGATAIAAGGAIRIFGVVGDGFNFAFGLTASVVTHLDDTILCQAPFVGDPLMVYDANATNAGFINNLLFAYLNK